MFFIIIILGSFWYQSSLWSWSQAGYNAPGYEQFRGKLPKENKVTSLQLKSLWGNHPVGHEGTNLQKKKLFHVSDAALQ